MFKQVSVIGAGTMGNGIAHQFAECGFDVKLIDVNPAQLETALQIIGKNLDRKISKGLIDEPTKSATLNRIKSCTDLEDGLFGSDLAVEAATENVELKLKIFKQLDELAAPETIIATNTSSISITRIAAVTNRPDKIIGMHFMNPVPVMKLVEIINGFGTDASVTMRIKELAIQLQKVPCVVNDYPGFIANRILMPMINEAVFSLYEGVAGVNEIDTVMKLGMAHPMGPLQLADFIGLDVCHAILKVLHEGFGNPKYAPCPLLSNMVMAGFLGVKSGEGFYKYESGNKELVVSPRFVNPGT